MKKIKVLLVVITSFFIISFYESEWYCSELCWAAYKYINYDLDPINPNLNYIVSPSSIISSPLLTSVNIGDHCHHVTTYYSCSSTQHYYRCDFCRANVYSLHNFIQYPLFKKCSLCNHRINNDGKEIIL